MTHEKFKTLCEQIYRYNYNGGDIVIFAKQRYEFETEYEDFEIVISKNENVPDCYDAIEIDWDYNEGQDDYILDGWCHLSDLLYRVHERGDYII